ncbi:hypothetical protein QBC42DRAFT_275406 [Cladorrhinum samala]|uniref:DUF1749-domain-containing protein n=1 Tax=Cladorrhinum samala TaxID=585594 RepID=A0AAV9HD76_9PEZI|nr:hypothetical protein QBC42DRAFT_275406 [Cladorrhinum samala]
MPPPYPLLLHTFPSSEGKTLQAFQHPSSNSSQSPSNALVFVPGLGDRAVSIPYTRRLSASLPPSYTLFEPSLSSASSAFGYSSLSQDAAELQSFVTYLRTHLSISKIILMGHSTGCQDCLEYVLTYGEEPKDRVDGIVLQGPVSDREAINMTCDRIQVEESIKAAEDMMQTGRMNEVMQSASLPEGWRGSPVTAYRWLSLAAKGGHDDYFSSDLSDDKLENIWGRLRQPVLILPSGKDEWVPELIDVEVMVERWKRFCPEGIASELSGLIPGANHRVEGAEEGERWLVDRVVKFLEGI